MVENQVNKVNIHTKLQKIQGRFTEILKDQTNKFQNYKYFTEYQVLTFLKPLLNEQKLTLTFADLPELGHSAEKNDKNWAVKYWKQATLTNSEKTDERLEFKFWAVSENTDLAKAKGSAETYAIKYMLSKFFLMPVKDEADPDYRQREEKDGMTTEERTAVNDLLKKHGWNKEENQK